MKSRKVISLIFLLCSAPVVAKERLLRRSEFVAAAEAEAKQRDLFYMGPSVTYREEEPEPEDDPVKTTTEVKAASSSSHKGCIIFLSSKTYKGDMSGIDGADEKCNDLAKAAGIKIPGVFKALLYSDRETDPDWYEQCICFRVTCRFGLYDYSALTRLFSTFSSNANIK